MTVVYKGSRFQVVEKDRWQIIEHPGVAVILPLLDPQTILLIKNHRVAVGATLWEVPAGTLELGENPLDCAKRELEEETGYKGNKFKPLADFYSSPGISNEKIFCYVAEDLVKTQQKLDEREQIEVVPVAWGDALEMIRKGEIIDAKTIICLLKYTLY